MSRLISNYEGINGPAISGRYPHFCKRCRKTKCRRHGGPPKPGDRTGHGSYVDPLDQKTQMYLYLHNPRKARVKFKGVRPLIGGEDARALVKREELPIGPGCPVYFRR